MPWRPRTLVALATGLLLLAPLAQASLMLHFRNQFGALELYDAGQKLSFRVNPARLTTPLQACGMANLAVAVAALKHGVLASGRTTLAFDPERHQALSVWPRSWTRPQNLAQAFRYDVQWYFDDLAMQLGPAKVAAELKALGFAAPVGPPARPGQWEIHTLALVEVIKRLDEGRLGLTAKANEELRQALKREEHDGRSMYALGTRCVLADDTPFAWRAGLVLGNPRPIYFGLHLQGASLARLKGESRRIIADALAEMEYY